MPPALRGVDICASAQTGSGKTAAFMLPALERLMHRPRRIAATRVLVLCPTRELAAQCEEMGRQLARFTDVNFALVVGGLSSKGQEAAMRSRPDIVVATPGRLIDLLRNAPSFGLDELESTYSPHARWLEPSAARGGSSPQQLHSGSSPRPASCAHLLIR